MNAPCGRAARVWSAACRVTTSPLSGHLAQAWGCGTEERKEKSQSSLTSAGNGAVSCAPFLLGGFANALPYLQIR